MEFSLKTFLSKYLGVSLSALLLDPIDLSNNSILKYRPTQVYTSSLIIPISAFELQADFRYIKKYENMDDNLKIQINDHDARVDIKVVDLRFTADFKKLADVPISLSLHIKNALDYYYTEIPGSLAPTRFIGMTTQLEL